MVYPSGDAKSEDTTNKEAGEEKPEEDNDYHRSDEQVQSPQTPADVTANQRKNTKLSFF